MKEKSLSREDIKKILENTPKTISVLFLGSAGIGKSESVYNFAQEEAKKEGREFIDFHEIDRKQIEEIEKNPKNYYVFVDFRLTEALPEDLIGIPHRSDHSYTYLPPEWAKLLSLPNISGLLFLDEITNVQRDDLISASYKIILDRKVGFIKLSDNIRVICAGNKPEHSSIARLLPAPLLNRLEIYEISPPSLDDWVRYMNRKYGDEWDKRTIAYLRRFPEHFIREPREAEGLEGFPTPRSWTRLAIQTINIKDLDLLKMKAISNLGVETGTLFYEFVKKPIPTIQELLKNPNIINDLEMDRLLLTMVMIGNNINEKILKNERKKVINLFKTIIKKDLESFALAIISTKQEIKSKLADVLVEEPEISRRLLEILDYYT